MGGETAENEISCFDRIQMTNVTSPLYQGFI